MEAMGNLSSPTLMYTLTNVQEGRGQELPLAICQDGLRFAQVFRPDSTMMALTRDCQP